MGDANARLPCLAPQFPNWSQRFVKRLLPAPCVESPAVELTTIKTVHAITEELIIFVLHPFQGQTLWVVGFEARNVPSPCVNRPMILQLRQRAP